MLSLPLLIITCHTTSAAIAYAACFYYGFTVICRYTVLFVWASELFPPGYGSDPITLLRATIGTIFISINFYFMFVSKSFEPIFQAAAVLILIVYMLVAIIPESPEWLLSQGDNKETIKAFKTIAKLNKKEDPRIDTITLTQ